MLATLYPVTTRHNTTTSYFEVFSFEQCHNMSETSDISQSPEYLSFRASIPLKKVAVDSKLNHVSKAQKSKHRCFALITDSC